MNYRATPWTILFVSLGASLVAKDAMAAGDPPQAVECNTHSDCNDNNECTVDFCNQCSGKTCKKKRWCSHSQGDFRDNSNCTDDICVPGQGVSHPERKCPPPDQCHLQGQCYLLPHYYVYTGCTTPNAPDGTPCNDGNACTMNDTCQNGACVGANPANVGIEFETRPYTVADPCSSGTFPSWTSVGYVGPSAALNFGTSDSFSIGFWAALDPANMHVMVKGDNGTNEWSIIAGASAICLRRQGVADLLCHPRNTAGFHHHVITYQAGTITMYEDGVEKATGSGQIGAAQMTTLKIGNYDQFNDNVVGKLDSVALWSRVLTAAEVQNLYYRTTTPAALGNLAGQWNFDEGSGSTVADASGNGNAVTLLDSGFSPTCANPAPTSTAQAQTIFNSLPTGVMGYGKQSISSLESWSNQVVLGGTNSNVAYHVKFGVAVGPTQVGKWGFRLGPDFGYGGTLVVDGVEVTSRWASMWWNGSFYDPSQSLTAYVNLTQGVHTVEIYGFENCCDGTGVLQFTAPGGSTLWQPLAKANLSTCG